MKKSDSPIKKSPKKRCARCYSHGWYLSGRAVLKCDCQPTTNPIVRKKAKNVKKRRRSNKL